MLSKQDGIELVKLARQTVENHFKNREIKIKETKFKEKKGVFVSIHTYPDHNLRGCVGYSHPIFALGEALQKASFSAAFQDTRFLPLTEGELKKIVFEVSILTVPKLIRVKIPREYLEKIKIGKDGLVIEYDILHKGLLLPHVATEYGWDVETFLEHLCIKAGLFQHMWKNHNSKIYKFNTQIFTEKRPYGDIMELKTK